MKFQIKDEHIRFMRDCAHRIVQIVIATLVVCFLVMCLSACSAPQEKPTPIKQIKQTLDCFNYCYA